jgi:hypothetical protein
MFVTTTPAFDALIGTRKPDLLRQPVQAIKEAISQLPQYEPETEHHFHAGMYCRVVKRCEGALIVGKVHKQEHLYVVMSGTVAVSQEGEPAKQITGPAVIKSYPGTQRAVLALTDAVCMTVHITDAKTVEEAEAELVEHDPTSKFDAFNRVKCEVLK